MNKKELAEMEQLKTLLALKHYPAVEPDIMPPPAGEDGMRIINGFFFNAYNMQIFPACTSCVSHAVGNWNKTTSQGAKKLYSTNDLAVRAMLHEMAMDFARKLRAVEKLMEVTSGEKSSG